MRVLIVPEYGSSGGTRSYFFNLLGLHIKQGVKTAVLIRPKQCDDEALEFLAKNDVKVFKAKSDINKGFRGKKSAFSMVYCWLCEAFLLLMPLISFRPDLVVVSNGTPGDMLGVLLFPIPVIYVMHTYPNKFTRAQKLMLRMTSFQKNRFVTVSHYSAKMMQCHMSLPERLIEVVHNSFEHCATHTPCESPLILTLGHVVKYKNPRVWLDVAQKVRASIPNARFVWLGDGPLLVEMRDISRLEGCAHFALFEGYSAEVEKSYATAWVYFQPSLVESHGLSVLDAMASTLPCVASNVGGLPESVVDGETGYLCNPDDVNSFSERIIQLINDSILRERMGSAARRRVFELFHPDIQERKLLGLYMRVAKGC